MQKSNETNADACAYNDLALVKVDPAYVADVNPSIPFWGGPVGINTTGTQPGDQLYTYGNSSLRAGVSALSPHVGVSIGDDGNGWSHGPYSVTPGIPGDSGSAFLDTNGKALGVLSTIGLAPLPASNNIGDINKELTYAKASSALSGLTLVPGTEPFTPSSDSPLGENQPTAPTGPTSDGLAEPRLGVLPARRHLQGWAGAAPQCRRDRAGAVCRGGALVGRADPPGTCHDLRGHR